MGFELYLQCFEDGLPSGVSRQRSQDVFGENLYVEEPNCWRIYYDERNWCHIRLTPLKTDAELIHAAFVDRPCGDARLWTALIEIMRLGNVLMYFPGVYPPLIVNSNATRHAPTDMIELLGIPAVVQNGEDIIEHIKKA